MELVALELAPLDQRLLALFHLESVPLVSLVLGIVASYPGRLILHFAN